MEPIKIFESEYRLCKLVWKNEPIRSGKLVALCQEELGWKASTTYTVIKKLSERGVLTSEKMVVRSLVKEAEAQETIVREILDTKFDNSSAAFITAFSKTAKLTNKDIDEVEEIIKQIRENRKKT